MKRAKTYVKKGLIVALGCAISVFGLVLAIRAGFGASTFTTMLDGVAHTLSITMGQASWIINAAIFLFCIFYDRRQVHIGTVIVLILTGIFIDYFTSILVYPQSRVLCFLLMLLGIVIMGFGAAVQAFAEFGRGAYEAFTFAFVDKNGWQVRRVRIILDIIMVVIGVLLGGKAGLCTVATIPICGPVIQVSLKWLNKRFPNFHKNNPET